MIEVISTTSTILISIFDVHTTTYFLTDSSVLEEHEEVNDGAV